MSGAGWPSRRIAPAALLTLLVGAGCGRSSLADDVSRLLADYGGDRPGACVLVRHDGVALYERCVGLAELETRQAATPRTNFRLASVTKQFTATAVLTLMADGRIDSATTLRTVLPGFPPWADAITVHHLLTHTSGLPDYEDLMPADADRQITDAEVVALLRAQDSTDFPAGSAYHYSNSGYAVLAEVVAVVSGTPFSRYLDEAIFAPLGMTRSVAHVEGVTSVARRAYGYSRTADSSWTRTDQSPTSAVLGDGGVYTSIRDLDRWFAMLEGRRPLLPPAVATRMFTAATSTDQAGVAYGYGWFLDQRGTQRRYFHTGTTIGFRNAVQRLPDAGITVVFLSNRNEIDAGLVDAIVAAVQSHVATPPR